MIVIEIFVILLALLLTGFFSGSETALLSCNRVRLRSRLERGSASAKILWSLIQEPQRILATMLVGTNICVVTISVLATHVCLQLFSEKGPLVATVTMTPLIVVFGEMIPKSIFRYHASKILFITAPLLMFVQKILSPIVILVQFMSGIIIRGFGLKKSRRDPFLTKEDIELLVRQITSEGVLETSEQEAIHQIFDFRHKRVGDIMITLRDVVKIDFNDDRNTIIERARRFGFTRYPVLQNKQVVGILNIYDIFYSQADWHEHMRPVRKVHPNQRVAQLFLQMKEDKELMCVVVRKGKLVGIVTLEDIIQEIELT